MANNEELVEQFVDITKDTEDRARFFLEANNWTLELALTQYYMTENEDGARPARPAMPMDEDEDDDDSDEDFVPSAEPDEDELPRRSSRKKKEKPTSSSNVVTLNSMADSSSDEEQGQAFYAGGSERSGQQVLGPPKKNPIKDYVSEIFRSAQESGAEVVDPHTRHAAHAGSSRGGAGGSVYAGTGYRLGMTDNDHTVLPSASAGESSRPGSRPQTVEPIIIKLWSNGLSINDGPLRPYEEPENQSFLNSIKRGEIPAELRKLGHMPVHVDLEDHRKEEYKAPKKKISMFAGEGHKLGNPAPTVTGSTPSSTATSPTTAAGPPPPTAVSPDENAQNEKRASQQLKLDDAQPTTMIQIRLADGSRLAARFNHTHTVEDIRQFIGVARPVYGAQRFNLLTTFPSKELTDGSVTVKDAGLLNAALLQRLA